MLPLENADTHRSLSLDGAMSDGPGGAGAGAGAGAGGSGRDKPSAPPPVIVGGDRAAMEEPGGGGAMILRPPIGGVLPYAGYAPPPPTPPPPPGTMYAPLPPPPPWPYMPASSYDGRMDRCCCMGSADVPGGGAEYSDMSLELGRIMPYGGGGAVPGMLMGELRGCEPGGMPYRGA